MRTVSDPWAKSIGQRIRQARDTKGLSRPDLADLLELHERTLANYERGEHLPFRDLPRIAGLLGVDLKILLHGAELEEPLAKLTARLTTVEDKLDSAIGQITGYIKATEQLASAMEQEARARQSEQTASASKQGTRGPRRKAQ